MDVVHTGVYLSTFSPYLPSHNCIPLLLLLLAGLEQHNDKLHLAAGNIPREYIIITIAGNELSKDGRRTHMQAGGDCQGKIQVQQCRRELLIYYSILIICLHIRDLPFKAGVVPSSRSRMGLACLRRDMALTSPPPQPASPRRVSAAAPSSQRRTKGLDRVEGSLLTRLFCHLRVNH